MSLKGAVASTHIKAKKAYVCCSVLHMEPAYNVNTAGAWHVLLQVPQYELAAVAATL
jgi:hypothetical protein